MNACSFSIGYSQIDATLAFLLDPSTLLDSGNRGLGVVCNETRPSIPHYPLRRTPNPQPPSPNSYTTLISDSNSRSKLVGIPAMVGLPWYQVLVCCEVKNLELGSAAEISETTR